MSLLRESINRKLVFLIFVFPTFAQANSLCGKPPIRELGRVAQDGKTLVACGIPSEKRVTKITIIEAGAEPRILYQSDDTYKRYRLTNHKRKLSFTESLNEADAESILELTAECSSGNCTVKPTRCLWKKKKPDETSLPNLIEGLKNRNASSHDLEQIYEAMLNGSAQAKSVFQTTPPIHPENNPLKDEFKTYQADLPRLKTAGCL